MALLQEHPELWVRVEEYKRLKDELEVKLRLLQEINLSLLDPFLSPREKIQLRDMRSRTVHYIETLKQRLEILQEEILREASESGIGRKEVFDALGEEIFYPSEPETEGGEKISNVPNAVPSVALPATFERLVEVYKFIEFIGEGGFARVYKVKRKKDGKVVALKIPKSLDPATGKSFLKEITNWLHLKHPNIVRLYDANILPIPFLEMEYCESSLAELRKPLPVGEASLMVFNIAEGLKYAHSKGIVHRDLKPSNILIKEGIPKISDWGLSKVLEESMSTTTTASFTPFYAAPEQIDKKYGKTDKRTDIWQLGVIFYELVTGKLPFDGDSLLEVISKIVNDRPVLPGEINPEVKRVEPIIMRMLAQRKEERYQSVDELQKDLARVLNMTYSESLRESKTLGDVRGITYYLTELLLINLKTNNPAEAYKYASDLAFYVNGDMRKAIEKLAEQLKLRLEEGLKIPPELIEKAEIIVHKIRVGLGA